MNIYFDKINDIGQKAKYASKELAKKTNDEINNLLINIANTIDYNVDFILKDNIKDINLAKKSDKPDSFIDRLKLNKDRIKNISSSIRSITKLNDPTYKLLSKNERPNGLIIKKISVPLGTLGMIYESRPNVTTDAAALCLKSRNSVILRGGSDSYHSSLALFKLIQQSLINCDFPPNCVSMIESTDREYVGAMLKCNKYIDVIIPRGGKNLIKRVMDESKIPVFSHLDGICHTYIDKDADHEMAINIVINAKLRRTGICGATETILLHNELSDTFTKKIVDSFLDQNCKIYGDKKIQKISNKINPASDNSWRTEYLDKKLNIKLVNNVNDAIDHINEYGSHHTDAIITNNQLNAETFTNEVDSANVMLNTSTQFADGGEFGMGAEIGIATGKLHARGPVGIEQLSTYKYVIIGSGQTRPI